MNYLITNLGSGLVSESVKGKISESYKQKATELTNFYIKPNKNIAKRPPLRQVTEFGELTNVVDTAATATRQIFLRKWDNSNVETLDEWNNILREITNVRTGYETNSDLFQAVDPYEEGFEYQIFLKRQELVEFDIHPANAEDYRKGTDNTIYIKTHARENSTPNTLQEFRRAQRASDTDFTLIEPDGQRSSNLAIMSYTVQEFTLYDGSRYTGLDQQDKPKIALGNALGPHDCCLMFLPSGVYFGVDESEAAKDTGRYGTISVRIGNFSTNVNTRVDTQRLSHSDAENITGLGNITSAGDDIENTTWYRVTSSDLRILPAQSVDIGLHSPTVNFAWISSEYEHDTPDAPVVGRTFDPAQNANPVSTGNFSMNQLFTTEPFTNINPAGTTNFIATSYDVERVKLGELDVANPDRGAEARLYITDTARASGHFYHVRSAIWGQFVGGILTLHLISDESGRNLNNLNLTITNSRRLLPNSSVIVRLENNANEDLGDTYQLNGQDAASYATATLSGTDANNFYTLLRDRNSIVYITGIHDGPDDDITIEAIGERFNDGTPRANHYVYDEGTGVVTLGANVYDTEWSFTKPEIDGPAQKVWKMGITTIDAVRSRPEANVPFYFDIKSDLQTGQFHYGEFTEVGIVDANESHVEPPELHSETVTTRGRTNPIHIKLNDLYTTLDTNLEGGHRFTPPSANSTDRVWMVSDGVFTVPGANAFARELVLDTTLNRVDTHVNPTKLVITQDGQEYRGAIKFDRAALEVTLYLTSRVNLGRIWIDQGNHSIYFDTRQEPHATGTLGPAVRLNDSQSTVVYQGLRGDRPGVFNIDSSFFPEASDKTYYIRIEDPSVEIDFQHSEHNRGTPGPNSYVFDEETGEITFGTPENERQWAATNLPRRLHENDTIWTMNIATVRNKDQENGKFYPIYSTTDPGNLTEGTFSITGLRQARLEDAEVHELFEKIGQAYFNTPGLLNRSPIQKLPDFAVIDVYDKETQERVIEESFLFSTWTPDAYNNSTSNNFSRTFTKSGENDRTVYSNRAAFDYLLTGPTQRTVELDASASVGESARIWEDYINTFVNKSPTYLWIVGQGIDITDSNESFDHFLYRGIKTDWTTGPEYHLTDSLARAGYSFRNIGKRLFDAIGIPTDGLNNADLTERHLGDTTELPERLESRANGIGFRAFGLSYTWDTTLACDNSGVAAWRSADTKEERMNTFPEKTVRINLDNLPIKIAEFEPYKLLDKVAINAITAGYGDGTVVPFSPDFYEFKDYVNTHTDYSAIKTYLKFALTDIGLAKDGQIYDREDAVVSLLPDIKITEAGTDMNAVGKYLYSLPDGSHLFVADHTYLNMPKPHLTKENTTGSTIELRAGINQESHLPYRAGLSNGKEEDNRGFEADTGSAMGGVGVTIYRQVGNKIDPVTSEPIFYPWPTAFPSNFLGNDPTRKNENRADTLKVIYLTLDYTDGTTRIADLMKELKLISWYSSRGTQGYNAPGMVQIDKPARIPTAFEFSPLNYINHLQAQCFRFFSKIETYDDPDNTGTNVKRVFLNWIPWFTPNVYKYTYKYATYKQPRVTEYQKPNTESWIKITGSSTATVDGRQVTTYTVDADSGFNSNDNKSTYYRDIKDSSLGLPGTTDNNNNKTGTITAAHLGIFAGTSVINRQSRAVVSATTEAEIQDLLDKARAVRGGGTFLGVNGEVNTGLLSIKFVRPRLTSGAVNSEYRDAAKPSAADRRLYGIPYEEYRSVRFEGRISYRSVWRQRSHTAIITGTRAGKEVTYTLDRRAGARYQIDKVIQELEAELAQITNAVAGGPSPYSTNFVTYDFITGNRYDTYERDIVATGDTVSFAHIERPGVFSLGYKKFYESIPNNRSSTQQYKASGDLGGSIALADFEPNREKDPVTYRLKPEFGREIKINDIVETQYGALMVTNQKVYRLGNLRKEPAINVSLDDGFDTQMVFDSSTYFGAIGDKVKALRYFREVDGYLSQVVNKQLDLPGPVTSMAGLLNKYKLLFVHCQAKGDDVYVLSFGENRAVNGWSKFNLPFPVTRIFTTDDDSLLLVTGDNATYRMDFSADISKDQYKWRDQLPAATAYQTYETAITTMPIINVNEEDFSVTDNTNITKFIAGMIGNPVFDVQVKGNDFFNRRYSQNDSEITSIEYRDADGSALTRGINVSGQVLVENIAQNGSNQPQLRITKNDENYIEFSSFNILLGKG